MQSLRRSRVSAWLLSLIVGCSVLIPEIGHAAVHRHGTQHRLADVAHEHDAGTVHAQSGAELADGQGADTHTHIDLRTTSPAKQSLAYLANARTLGVLVLGGQAPRPVPIAREPLVVAGRRHGPPPPSRAPPLF